MRSVKSRESVNGEEGVCVGLEEGESYVVGKGIECSRETEGGDRHIGGERHIRGDRDIRGDRHINRGRKQTYQQRRNIKRYHY